MLFRSFLLGSWEVSGIWSLHSGTPFTIYGGSGNNNSLSQVGNDHADYVSGQPLNQHQGSKNDWLNQYFNTAAYVANQSGVFGNAPRADSQLRNPGSITVNLGLFKSFRGIAESHKLQFRSEFFNILNRPNFGAASANLDGACFGCLTSAADGRLIQMALKYIF